MSPRQDLEVVRSEVAWVHKRLSHDARARYEETHGAIIRPGELMRIVAFDPEFASLHPLTGLIIDIDERLGRRRVCEQDIREVRAEVVRLFGADARSFATA